MILQAKQSVSSLKPLCPQIAPPPVGAGTWPTCVGCPASSGFLSMTCALKRGPARGSLFLVHPFAVVAEASPSPSRSTPAKNDGVNSSQLASRLASVCVPASTTSAAVASVEPASRLASGCVPASTSSAAVGVGAVGAEAVFADLKSSRATSARSTPPRAPTNSGCRTWAAAMRT